MTAYLVPEDLALRHRDGEETAVVRLGLQGTTHLVAAEALVVVQAVASCGRAVGSREIAHVLGQDATDDPELAAGLQRIIDGLVQSGLLRQRPDDAEPGGEPPR